MVVETDTFMRALDDWRRDVAVSDDLDATLREIVGDAWRREAALGCGAAVFAATIWSRSWRHAPLDHRAEDDTPALAQFWARWAAALPAARRHAAIHRVTALPDAGEVALLEAAAVAPPGPSRAQLVARLRALSQGGDDEWGASAALAAALLSDGEGLEDATARLRDLSRQDVSPLYRGPVDAAAASRILDVLRGWSKAERRGLGRWLLRHLDVPGLAHELLEDYLGGGLSPEEAVAADELAPRLNVDDLRRLLDAWPCEAARAATSLAQLTALGHAAEARSRLGPVELSARGASPVELAALRRMLPHAPVPERMTWAEELLDASAAAPAWAEVVAALPEGARERLRDRLPLRGDDEAARWLAAWPATELSALADVWLAKPRRASAGAWLALGARSESLRPETVRRLGEHCLVAVSELGRPGVWGVEDDHGALADVAPQLMRLGGADLLLEAAEAIHAASMS